ncbi:aromatic amino acid hydroxylase [bacterium]|nr:MAG: aromatic amino acid hydroxylase [bacterium]
MVFTTQEEIIQSIPSYLRQFVVEQDYDMYTPQDHAVWRYIMHRNVSFLQDKAHQAYMNGLVQTGITLEKIPNIIEMNDCLGKIGWKAVVVDGFVPPAAFMEFQALKILVVSAEMRNINNVLYTPAPDIVHEAAGHAPIIANIEYSEYLRKFGEYGMKSVFSKEDYEIYEAIRYLSIIKEYPETPEEEIKRAEKDLDEKMNSNNDPSESNLLSRMHWWTVEYGLLGTPESFKIFGAGLLSSVGESKHCMDDVVKKIPLSTDCVNYAYDITNMQPQLFVARDFEHLTEVLEAYADTMCFRKGGLESLKQIQKSRQVGTYVLDSGIQVSGMVSDIKTDSNGNIAFIKTVGNTALAYQDNQLNGHGIEYHHDGFSSPIGKLKDLGKSINQLSDSEVLRLGLVENNNVNLIFESEIHVSGTIREIIYNNERQIMLISFSNCTVTWNDELLFNPTWGQFDMVIGSEVVSAYSGSADKEHFNVYPPKSEKKAIKIVHTDEQKHLFKLYTYIREMRESGHIKMDGLYMVYEQLSTHFKKEWLLRWEILEILMTNQIEDKLIEILHTELLELRSINETYHNVISGGLSMILAK